MSRRRSGWVAVPPPGRITRGVRLQIHIYRSHNYSVQWDAQWVSSPGLDTWWWRGFRMWHVACSYCGLVWPLNTLPVNPFGIKKQTCHKTEAPFCLSIRKRLFCDRIIQIRAGVNLTIPVCEGPLTYPSGQKIHSSAVKLDHLSMGLTFMTEFF